MIKFEYDDKGNLIVIKNGKKIGEMLTMVDAINNNKDNSEKKQIDIKKDTQKQPGVIY